jgi:hypothetical protein
MLNDFMKKTLEEDLENKKTRVKRTLGFLGRKVSLRPVVIGYCII